MPNWFINSVAAKLLNEEHGLPCNIFNKAFNDFSGIYWYDFDAGRLIRHPYLTRMPKYQLNVDDVLALILMPEEARNAYVEAVGTIWVPSSPSDS